MEEESIGPTSEADLEESLEDAAGQRKEEWPSFFDAEFGAAAAAPELGPALQAVLATDSFAVGDRVRLQGKDGLRDLDGWQGQAVHVAVGSLLLGPWWIRISAIESKHLRTQLQPGALTKRAPATASASSRCSPGRGYAYQDPYALAVADESVAVHPAPCSGSAEAKRGRGVAAATAPKRPCRCAA